MQHFIVAFAQRSCCLTRLISILVLAVFVSPVSPTPFDADHLSSSARSSGSSGKSFLSSSTLLRLSLISVFLIVLCRLIAHRLDVASERHPHKLWLLHAQIALLIVSYDISVPVGLAISMYGIVTASLESGLAGVSVLAAIYFANYSSWNSCSRLRQLWYRIPNPTWLSHIGCRQLSRTVKALIRLAMDEDSSTHLPFYERVEMAMLYLKFTETVVTAESGMREGATHEESPPSSFTSHEGWGNVLKGVEGTWVCTWAQRFHSPSQNPRDNFESIECRESPTSVTSSAPFMSRLILPQTVRDTHQQSSPSARLQSEPNRVIPVEYYKPKRHLGADETLRYVVAYLEWIRPVRFSYTDRCESYECYKWVMRQHPKCLLCLSRS